MKYYRLTITLILAALVTAFARAQVVTQERMAQIYEEVKNDLPTGFAKGRVQYGMTHQWAEEVVKIDGKPNTYRLK